jgi:tetratricopeptide (TPR) repeat protein
VLLSLLAAALFTVEGRLEPASAAEVTLHAADSPWTSAVRAGLDGRFRIRDVKPGAYTLSVFIPQRGERRMTVSVGPTLADKRGTVRFTIRVDAEQLSAEAQASVSAKELSVPTAARRLYARAQERLRREDNDGAVKLLSEAVEMAPQFSAAWNNLGTICYQTRRYEQAEEYFRKALEADEDAYEPLVNLGGVLVTTRKLDEAWQVNVRAVNRRDNDPLAHAQLGMTYLYLGKLELAEKHLRVAVQLDPAHFSHPQLHLAEIYYRRGDRMNAAAQLKELLKLHPDMPSANAIRETIEKLQTAGKTAR